MTGGYLILERPNTGLVLSTNARFYAIVKPISEEVKPESWAWVCPSSRSMHLRLVYVLLGSIIVG